MADITERQKKLPDEILESQKTRSTLLKWKLAIVASLGAAGLGLASETSTSYISLLSLIPFVCVYVDLLCTNINLRIILIGQYLAEKCKDSYELYASEHRDWFALEDWALYWSTYCVSAILGLYALWQLVLCQVQKTNTGTWKCTECLGILIACIIGPCFTIITQQAYKKKIKAKEKSRADNS
jgi:hypothetical protein